MRFHVGERVWHKANKKEMTVESVDDAIPGEPAYTCSWLLRGDRVTGAVRGDNLVSIDPRFGGAKFIDASEDKNPSDAA